MAFRGEGNVADDASPLRSPVDDAEPMEMLQGADDLGRVEARHVRVEGAVLHDVGQEFPVLCIGHHKVCVGHPVKDNFKSRSAPDGTDCKAASGNK